MACEPPHPLGPGGVPPGTRYARRPWRKDPEEGEEIVPPPPQDPGEEALRSLGGLLLTLLVFPSLIWSVVTMEALHRGSPGIAPLLRWLPAPAATLILALLLDGLGRRREWARRAYMAAVCLPALAAALAWLAGALPGLPGVLVVGSLAWGARSQVRLMGRPDVRAVFRPDQRPEWDDESCLPQWAWLHGTLGLMVGLDAAQLLVREQTGVMLVSEGLSGPAIVLGSILGAGLIVAALALALRWKDEARRDPDLIPPVTRARIVSLRGEGRSARQIAHALDEEGLPAPGGRWTGRLLREALRTPRPLP